MEKKLPDSLLLPMGLISFGSALIALRGLALLDFPWKRIVFASVFLSPALLLLSLKIVVTGTRSAAVVAALFSAIMASLAWVLLALRLLKG